jgi:hypothetical protein
LGKDQIYIASNFTIELRRKRFKGGELPAQSDFLLLHSFKPQYARIPGDSTILLNPHQSIRLQPSRRAGDLLIVRLAPALLIEVATKLKMLPAGSQSLFRNPGEPVTNDDRLRETLESIRRELEGKAAGWTEMIGSLINPFLSEFHFARLFKKITGSTPHAYLASLRIERARRLLAETDASINEIGASVGYATQSHFTKVFREATRMTPREFRLAARR